MHHWYKPILETRLHRVYGDLRIPISYRERFGLGALLGAPGALRDVPHDDQQTLSVHVGKLRHRLHDALVNPVPIRPPKPDDEHSMMRCRAVPREPLVGRYPLPKLPEQSNTVLTSDPLSFGVQESHGCALRWSDGLYCAFSEDLLKAEKRQRSSGEIHLPCLPVSSPLIQPYGSRIASVCVQSNTHIGALLCMLLCKVHQSASNTLPLIGRVNTEAMNN
jgi:hypothetical protein